jgi:hypothetical protein
MQEECHESAFAEEPSEPEHAKDELAHWRECCFGFAKTAAQTGHRRETQKCQLDWQDKSTHSKEDTLAA